LQKQMIHWMLLPMSEDQRQRIIFSASCPSSYVMRQTAHTATVHNEEAGSFFGVSFSPTQTHRQRDLSCSSHSSRRKRRQNRSKRILPLVAA
jgi:hypothetical protein